MTDAATPPSTPPQNKRGRNDAAVPWSDSLLQELTMGGVFLELCDPHAPERPSITITSHADAKKRLCWVIAGDQLNYFRYTDGTLRFWIVAYNPRRPKVDLETGNVDWTASVL